LIAYLDSSVVLRRVLGQADALDGTSWTAIARGVASALVEVECLRTLDRLRVLQGIAEDAIAARRETVVQLLASVELVGVSTSVLRRASQPFPVTLGTLDALHLATALQWRDATGLDVVMATHDDALATAARAMGLQVIGR
jgi:predicted nucleic acid-binding protein